MANKIIMKSVQSGKYTWAITRDIISNGERSLTPEKIKEIKKDCPHHFKLYDDDGILYYEGYSDDDNSERAFKPLDWAMYDSGCTEIKYRNPISGKYETL